MSRKYRYIGTDRRIQTIRGFRIADNFERVVHGGHGDYIEIASQDIVPPNAQGICIPDYTQWRLRSNKAYYLEYRTPDWVKLYFQKRLVAYADYKIGFWYVAPIDLQNFEIST